MKKNVLVIGGCGDIGQSISKLFSESYVVTATNRIELELSSIDSIDLFLNSNKKIFEHVVFCAAENSPQLFCKSEFFDIEKSIQINLLSITKILHSLIKSNSINSGGTIVIISSLYSYFGRIKRLPYSVSKHALNGLVKNLAIELSLSKIRVNSVSPGFIDTKLTRKNLNNDEIKDIEKHIPSGSLGKPDDIGNIVQFLSSQESKYINGQDIIADGGFSVGGFMGLK